MADSHDFGTLINERRLALGYSLGQLANRVRATASDVRAWERGQRAPNSALVARLAKELELDPGELSGAAERVRSAGAADSPAADGATATIATTVFSDAADTASVHPEDEENVVAEAKEERPPTPAAAQQAAPQTEESNEAAPADTAEPAVDVAADEPMVERPFWEEQPDVDEPATAVVAAAEGRPEDDGRAADSPTYLDTSSDVSATEPLLTDMPTEAVPVVPAAGAAAGPVSEAVATVLAPSRPTAPAPAQQTAGPSTFEPFTSFLRTLFDPERRYLFWIRTALLVIVMLVFLRILATAVPAFFDTIGEILDTIESTPTDTTLIPGG
jgi:transcriptional regulator with XRE-family HTH domain